MLRNGWRIFWHIKVRNHPVEQRALCSKVLIAQPPIDPLDRTFRESLTGHKRPIAVSVKRSPCSKDLTQLITVVRRRERIEGSASKSALCKNRMACMGQGSCFCVVQTKLPTHAGFFNNSNLLIFRKKNRGFLRVRPLFYSAAHTEMYAESKALLIAHCLFRPCKTRHANQFFDL